MLAPLDLLTSNGGALVSSVAERSLERKMTKKLSLLNHCRKCHAGCCKTGDLIGSPILSDEESAKIQDKSCLKEIISPVGEKYWIIAEEGTNRCHFLNDQDECELQKNKPLDCLCYPIKAVWKDNEIVYIIDTSCPAADYLSNEFINEAKKIALQSIKRFRKETYDHWLENYVGWIKSTEKQIK